LFQTLLSPAPDYNRHCCALQAPQFLEHFGVRRQSEAATALWIRLLDTSKAVSRCACHRTPNSFAVFVLQPQYDSLSFKSLVKDPGMNHFLDWRDHVGTAAEKFYKSTLWKGEHLMVGLNCLEPNQTQSVHAHQDADKFYFVLEGEGKFTVGNEERNATAGALVVAPAGVAHGVTNTSGERLLLLVAIAPGPK
jgi:mannose-6-phosphate isomerase-like protein (cupin superfamily)